MGNSYDQTHANTGEDAAVGTNEAQSQCLVTFEWNPASVGPVNTEDIGFDAFCEILERRAWGGYNNMASVPMPLFERNTLHRNVQKCSAPAPRCDASYMKKNRRVFMNPSDEEDVNEKGVALLGGTANAVHYTRTKKRSPKTRLTYTRVDLRRFMYAPVSNLCKLTYAEAVHAQ